MICKRDNLVKVAQRHYSDCTQHKITNTSKSLKFEWSMYLHRFDRFTEAR